MSECIKGRYIDFSYRGFFIYEYTCGRCGHAFREPCPEVSAPAICHKCYTRNVNRSREQPAENQDLSTASDD